MVLARRTGTRPDLTCRKALVFSRTIPDDSTTSDQIHLFRPIPIRQKRNSYPSTPFPSPDSCHSHYHCSINQGFTCADFGSSQLGPSSPPKQNHPLCGAVYRFNLCSIPSVSVLLNRVLGGKSSVSWEMVSWLWAAWHSSPSWLLNPSRHGPTGLWLNDINRLAQPVKMRIAQSLRTVKGTSRFLYSISPHFTLHSPLSPRTTVSISYTPWILTLSRDSRPLSSYRSHNSHITYRSHIPP